MDPQVQTNEWQKNPPPSFHSIPTIYQLKFEVAFLFPPQSLTPKFLLPAVHMATLWLEIRTETTLLILIMLVARILIWQRRCFWWIIIPWPDTSSTTPGKFSCYSHISCYIDRAIHVSNTWNSLTVFIRTDDQYSQQRRWRPGLLYKYHPVQWQLYKISIMFWQIFASYYCFEWWCRVERAEFMPLQVLFQFVKVAWK